MFRLNNNHDQHNFFETTRWMNPKIQKKLEKSWAPIFYKYVFCEIDESPFAKLYGTTGKPNFPINILLSLEYIKHMNNCNDLQLLEDFYFDYLVNYAVGIRVMGEMNLAERTLYYFRERVYQHCIKNPGSDDILFGQFINLLHNFAKEAGVKLDEQRTDTTLFMSNIKKAGRMSLAYDVLLKAVKAIPIQELTDSLSKVLADDFKTDVLYRTKANEGDSKLTLLLNLCKEALEILQTQPGMLESDEVRIVKRFLSEQSTETTDDEKVIPKPGKEILSDSLQSAYDEDATFRRKGNVSQSGYVLEISETCGSENTFQLITDYTVAPNNVSDVEILNDRLETISNNTGCTDMYIDGGFQSEDIHKTAKENGIEIHLTNMSGKEPSKKMPVSEFDIDETTNIIKRCPAGNTPVRTKVNKGGITAHFSSNTCMNCELSEKCQSRKQNKNFVVRISLKALNVSRERRKMKTNRRENTGKRAGIEGCNSALKRSGLEKLDVRGKAKSTVVCGIKVTVQNIKRFIKYMQGGYRSKKTSKKCKGILVPILS